MISVMGPPLVLALSSILFLLQWTIANTYLAPPVIPAKILLESENKVKIVWSNGAEDILDFEDKSQLGSCIRQSIGNGLDILMTGCTDEITAQINHPEYGSFIAATSSDGSIKSDSKVTRNLVRRKRSANRGREDHLNFRQDAPSHFLMPVNFYLSDGWKDLAVNDSSGRLEEVLA